MQRTQETDPREEGRFAASVNKYYRLPRIEGFKTSQADQRCKRFARIGWIEKDAADGGCGANRGHPRRSGDTVSLADPTFVYHIFIIAHGRPGKGRTGRRTQQGNSLGR